MKKLSFLATTLKEERKRAKLTQKELAKLTGLGLKTIRKIEQDDQDVLVSKVNFLLNFFGLELGPNKLITSPLKAAEKPISRTEILEILKGVFPIFKMKYGIKRLGLFGSYSRNEQMESSDIDILFEGESNLSNEGQITLILEHLLGGHKIDLTNKAAIDPRIKESILKGAIYA